MRHHVHLMSTRLSQHQSRAFVLALMWILYMADGGGCLCVTTETLWVTLAQSLGRVTEKRKRNGH